MATGGPNPKVREDDRRGAPAGREGGGQPAFEVREGEREKVAEYARCLTSRQIALVLRGPTEPLSKDTICRHFEDELAWGRAHFIAEAGGKLYDAVLAGRESSIHFALRTLGDPGQFVERRELTGKGGGPIQTLDLLAATELMAGMKDEDLPDLERAAAVFARLAGERAGTSAAADDPPGPDTGGNGTPPPGA